MSLTQEIGNTGVYATSSNGGPETVQVIKCRACSEILTASNYVKSEEKLKNEAAAARAKDAESARMKKEGVHFALVAIGVLVFVTVILSVAQVFGR